MKLGRAFMVALLLFSGTASAAGPVKVCVMSFYNATGQARYDWLSVTLQDSIIYRLRNVSSTGFDLQRCSTKWLKSVVYNPKSRKRFAKLKGVQVLIYGDFKVDASEKAVYRIYSFHANNGKSQKVAHARSPLTSFILERIYRSTSALLPDLRQVKKQVTKEEKAKAEAEKQAALKAKAEKKAKEKAAKEKLAQQNAAKEKAAQKALEKSSKEKKEQAANKKSDSSKKPDSQSDPALAKVAKKEKAKLKLRQNTSTQFFSYNQPLPATGTDSDFLNDNFDLKAYAEQNQDFINPKAVDELNSKNIQFYKDPLEVEPDEEQNKQLLQEANQPQIYTESVVLPDQSNDEEDYAEPVETQPYVDPTTAPQYYENPDEIEPAPVAEVPEDNEISDKQLLEESEPVVVEVEPEPVIEQPEAQPVMSGLTRPVQKPLIRVDIDKDADNLNEVVLYYDSVGILKKMSDDELDSQMDWVVKFKKDRVISVWRYVNIKGYNKKVHQVNFLKDKKKEILFSHKNKVFRLEFAGSEVLSMQVDSDKDGIFEKKLPVK